MQFISLSSLLTGLFSSIYYLQLPLQLCYATTYYVCMQLSYATLYNWYIKRPSDSYSYIILTCNYYAESEGVVERLPGGL